jgi:UrcA family protein
MNYAKILSLCSAVAITAAGLVVMTSPAFAKAPVVVTAPAPDDLVIRRIGYSDLNMTSAAGERTLNRRVGGAVDSLCSEAVGGDGTDFLYMPARHRCSNTAWDQARPQIAQAVQRARDIASTGSSSLAAVAITITIPE